MSFNLVDIVKSQISEQMMGQLGNMLGSDSSKLDSGLSSVIPGLISSLTQRASLPGGADSLLSAVNDQDSSLMDNMGDLLNNGEQNQVLDIGTNALTGLMGASGLGKLGDIIASVSGMSKGGAGSLLGMVAPIVVGQLKNKVLGDGLDAGGLLSLLNSQKDNVSSAMPAGMMDQFKQNNILSDISGDLSSAASSAGAAVGSVADTVGHSVEQASQSGGGIFKKLIPVAAVAVLGMLGWSFFGGSDSNEAETTAAAVTDAATEATTDVAGTDVAGTDVAATDVAAAATAEFNVENIGSDLTGMFDNAKGTLEGITDAGSASAALPQLNELSEQFGGLTDTISKVPEAARGPLSGAISSGLEGLMPIIEKARDIPGVGGVIDPVIGPVVEKLGALAG